MRILLVLNKPNREMAIMEAIKKEILFLAPNAHVEIWEMCTPVFNKDVLKFKPAVILTFPFTCTGFASWYYLFKLLFGCKILSLRAEGVVDFSTEYMVQWAIGFDHYGKQLVDYEIFWGSQVGEIIGQNLIKQGKLSTMERVKIIGYPRLESYFAGADFSKLRQLSSRIAERISNYPKKNIVFFATGFHFANYSRQDLFDAKDLDAENRIDLLLDGVEIAKRYRQDWIDGIIQTARQNPELLIVSKKHPIEKNDDYAIFEQIPNILYIYEDIDIQHIMPFTGLFFHYGSTSLVDSYLSKVPSVYVYSKNNKAWYADMSWPSSRKIDVSQIPALVQEHAAAGIPFVITPEITAILKKVFNIEEGKPYRPSRKIAELILQEDAAQKIPLTDIHLWKSLVSVFITSVILLTGKIIKKVLRMDPNAPLLKKKCSL
jgi:surface carbohydrate biosynthesis protein